MHCRSYADLSQIDKPCSCLASHPHRDSRVESVDETGASSEIAKRWYVEAWDVSPMNHIRKINIVAKRRQEARMSAHYRIEFDPRYVFEQQVVAR